MTGLTIKLIENVAEPAAVKQTTTWLIFFSYNIYYTFILDVRCTVSGSLTLIHSGCDFCPHVEDIVSIIAKNCGTQAATGLTVINKEMAFLPPQTRWCLLTVLPPQLTNVTPLSAGLLINNMQH